MILMAWVRARFASRSATSRLPQSSVMIAGKIDPSRANPARRTRSARRRRAACRCRRARLQETRQQRSFVAEPADRQIALPVRCLALHEDHCHVLVAQGDRQDLPVDAVGLDVQADVAQARVAGGRANSGIVELQIAPSLGGVTQHLQGCRDEAFHEETVVGFDVRLVELEARRGGVRAQPPQILLVSKVETIDRLAIQGVQAQAFPLQPQARQVGGIERRIRRRETNGPPAAEHQAQGSRAGVRPEQQLDAIGTVAPVACQQQSGNAGHPVVQSENLVQLPKLGLSLKGYVSFTPGATCSVGARSG